MMEPTVYRGKDTTLKTLETMCNARAWLKKMLERVLQKDATCNIQQYWQSWANDVGSVCTALKPLLILGIRYLAQLIVINLPYH